MAGGEPEKSTLGHFGATQPLRSGGQSPQAKVSRDMWARGEERVPATTLLSPPGPLSWVGAGLCLSQVKSAGTLELTSHRQVLTGADTSCLLLSRGRTPKTRRWKWLQPLLLPETHPCEVTVQCSVGRARGGHRAASTPSDLTCTPLGTPPPRPSSRRDKLQEGTPLRREPMPPEAHRQGTGWDVLVKRENRVEFKMNNPLNWTDD